MTSPSSPSSTAVEQCRQQVYGLQKSSRSENAQGNNAQCMNCSRQAAFVVLEFGIFVCDVCARVHHGFHHNGIKSIARSLFTEDDVYYLTHEAGNHRMRKLYFPRNFSLARKPSQALFDSNPTEFQRQVKLIIEQVYVDKKFYNGGNNSRYQFINDGRNQRPPTTGMQDAQSRGYSARRRAYSDTKNRTPAPRNLSGFAPKTAATRPVSGHTVKPVANTAERKQHQPVQQKQQQPVKQKKSMEEDLLDFLTSVPPVSQQTSSQPAQHQVQQQQQPMQHKPMQWQPQHNHYAQQQQQQQQLQQQNQMQWQLQHQMQYPGYSGFQSPTQVSPAMQFNSHQQPQMHQQQHPYQQNGLQSNMMHNSQQAATPQWQNHSTQRHQHHQQPWHSQQQQSQLQQQNRAQPQQATLQTAPTQIQQGISTGKSNPFDSPKADTLKNPFGASNQLAGGHPVPAPPAPPALPSTQPHRQTKPVALRHNQAPYTAGQRTSTVAPNSAMSHFKPIKETEAPQRPAAPIGNANTLNPFLSVEEATTSTGRGRSHSANSTVTDDTARGKLERIQREEADKYTLDDAVIKSTKVDDLMGLAHQSQEDSGHRWKIKPNFKPMAQRSFN